MNFQLLTDTGIQHPEEIMHFSVKEMLLNELAELEKVAGGDDKVRENLDKLREHVAKH